MTNPIPDRDRQAFPDEYNCGLSKREYAAIHIAAGACASETGENIWRDAEKFAAFVVMRTDTLLAELEKKGG